MPGSKGTAIKQVLLQVRIRFQSSRNLHEDAVKGGGGVRWLFFLLNETLENCGICLVRIPCCLVAHMK